MNKSQFLFLIAFLCAPRLAFAASSDWYSSISKSFALSSGRYKAPLDAEDVPNSYSIKQEGGSGVSFVLGYEFLSGFSFSAEVAALSLTEIVNNEFVANPSIYSTSLYLSNRFDIGSNLFPYLSLGLGRFIGDMDLPVAAGEDIDTGAFLFEGKGIQTSLRLGFSYLLLNNFFVDFGYRLFSFSYSTAEIYSDQNDFFRKVDGLENDIHSFEISLKIFWNS